MESNRLATRNNHTYENGRRYYGFKAEFPFPDDENATTAHAMISTIWHHLLDGRTFIAPLDPVKKNHKFLEFATRSGSWTIMALDRHRPAPRLTGGVITDYDRFYANAFRHLLPGGWLEVWENDLRFFTDNAQDEARLVTLREWEALIHEAAAKFDKRINVIAEQKELMHSAGFVQVDEQIFKVPFGEWSDDPNLKRIGSFYVYQMQCALEGYTLRLFTKTLGWSKEDTGALINRAQEELQQKDLRLYSYFHLIIGQKPAQAARKQ
ncbi:hypothetical protein VN97_g8347 [Penicillium thymicola]|uniref:Uncharacterized protein n=1 Tax=Penicillium thymicola TaxID=293382 RepID=A0AAI9X683_PENTH|nr:hypothetical protein VN97_g8347 [Penicillium thymicola]